MSNYIFNLPDIGEGIAEAEIVAWHVAVGDYVEEDSPLADIMTDKATVELEAPVSGRVVALAGEPGDMVAIGAMLVTIETEGGAAVVAPVPVAPAAIEAPVETPAPTPAPEAQPNTQQAPAPVFAADPVAEMPALSAADKVLASPAVRARAKDLGIDLGTVKPAADGRLRHADLDQYIAYNSAYSPAGAPRADEQIKVIGMRRKIAENMAAAKRNIPHFTYVEECDVTRLEELRAELNAAHADRPKLTLLPLLIRAICKTLPEYPMMNARYDDEAGVVTRYGAVNMGIAAQTEAGLMVPVLKGAEGKNLWQLAAEIARLAAAAKAGTIAADEMAGGTLTITSLGALGGIATTPVINRPEVAIIGPNKIVERPCYVADGQGGERIEKRKLMNISISCDHRVIDGWDAASFTQALKKRLESPALILVD